jgi:hypothetical protein
MGMWQSGSAGASDRSAGPVRLPTWLIFLFIERMREKLEPSEGAHVDRRRWFEAVATARFSAVFVSCEPGRALRGGRPVSRGREAEQNYLRREVPAFVAKGRGFGCALFIVSVRSGRPGRGGGLRRSGSSGPVIIWVMIGSSSSSMMAPGSIMIGGAADDDHHPAARASSLALNVLHLGFDGVGGHSVVTAPVGRGMAVF